VLKCLGDADGDKMRMCDLAASVVLSRSGLTRLVDRLERDGLLMRESCASDARGAFAKLTPAGRERLETACGTHRAGVRSLFLELVEPDELELLAGIWERVLTRTAAAVPADADCR
jgi:DNA-binding MarR family transcriptional regulator